MCTVVLLRRPDRPWPLILGANRDEMVGREWAPPGRHWPDRPEVAAGLDKVAGGSWMGVNERGVVAAILNRSGTLGPAAGKRSRGELVLDALDFPDAADAAEALAGINPNAYRPFNLVIADNRDAFWLAHRGAGALSVTPLPEEISMLTERDLNDTASPRIARYLPRFQTAPPPDPVKGDWAAWQALLEERKIDPALGEWSSLAFERPDGFGTVCHSLLALPAPGIEETPRWLFATAGTPAIWAEISV